MNIQPLGSRLLLQKEETPEVSPGGIIITPTVSYSQGVSCVVIAVGKYVTERETVSTDYNKLGPEFTFEEGDRVLIAPSAGVNVTFHKDEYLIVEAVDILAKISE